MLLGMDNTLHRANRHRLKTWPEYFQSVLSGAKPFEVRKDDRGFAVGDFLILEEWEPNPEGYTGNVHVVQVTYVLRGGQFGVESGYVVLGIQPAGR